MDKITIGLPRALLFYNYYSFFKSFFEQLDCRVIISDESNKIILTNGINKSIDESCLPLKLFLGHVENLKDKCDYILIPRIACLKKNEKVCTNFLVLYDLVNNLFDVDILHYNIDISNHESESLAFLLIGKQLGFSYIETLKAYKTAKKYEKNMKKNKILLQNEKLKSEKLKILIAGHSYNLYDKLIGTPIVTYLEKLNCEVIFSDIYNEKELDVESETISKDNYFTFNKKLHGAITHYKRCVDGIILLTSFPCGPDSLSNEMTIRKVKSVPILSLIIDEQDGLTGLYTRLESFIDILSEKRKVKSYER